MRYFRVLCGFMIIFLFGASWNQVRANPEDTRSKLANGAQAAILMDATSERVLYGKNEDKRMYIASLTKIMTAIVAIENKHDLNEEVVIGPNAVGVEGSSIYLKQGEKVPLLTLLYGLMLRSGNDAAVAIAEHVGGSVEGFTYLMNEKAEVLGLTNTHFMNPHGLDHPEHYSSAKDLARLTAYALKNATFQEIVKAEVKKVPWPGEQWNRTFYNKNKMLHFYQWADGVKTGYTKQARRTLVSSATKNGTQLITVTLNDGDDWKDSMLMFEYGFKNYELTPVLKEGQVISKTEFENDKHQRLYVVAGKAFQYPLTVEEKERITVEPIISYPLKLVKKGQVRVGSARIYLDQNQIGLIPLVTQYKDQPTVFSQWLVVLETVWGQGVRK